MTPEQVLNANCKDILDIGGLDSQKTFPNARVLSLDINPNSGADLIADAHHIPLPDASQDAVIAFDMIEHLHSPYIFVEEIKRVLRPHGYIYISAPFIHPYHGGMNAGTYCADYWRLTEDGLRLLFKDFSVDISSDGGLFYALSSFGLPTKWLDRLYSKGKSRHQYFVFGTVNHPAIETAR
jgi:SAM-dependent methyltransferase